MAVIKEGDSGAGVRAWQRIVGVGASQVDGKFGPKTADRVRAWQAAHGLEATGEIGQAERNAVDPAALIKPYEGLRLVTYDDHDGKPLSLVTGEWRRPDGSLCLGYPTIGWGRRLWPGEKITSCTPALADAWLLAMLGQTYFPAVNRRAPEGADGAQKAAMAACAYNCGTGWLGQLADAGFDGAVWMSRNRTKGVESAGLTMRRAEELALFRGEP